MPVGDLCAPGGDGAPEPVDLFGHAGVLEIGAELVHGGGADVGIGYVTKAWATSIVDVGRGQLLDIVAGRTAQAPVRWLLARPSRWLSGVRWAVLDLSGPYRAAFDTALPRARQVADPFHVVKLANTALDDVRRRVQNQTLGHRGHKHDPLYRARKLLVSASERITEAGRTKLRGLLDAGDPYGEVRDAWHAKETLQRRL